MLTPRKRQFAKEYLVDRNALQAARRCGYSAKTAGSQGSRLLKDVDVRALIDKAVDRVSAKLELKAEDVLRVLQRGLTFDPSRLFGPDGELLPIDQMPEDVRCNLVGLKTLDVKADGKTTGSLREVKWTPPMEAAKEAAKHLGLYKPERVEVETGPNLSGLLALAAQRRGSK